jgi:hypothetical protein
MRLCKDTQGHDRTQQVGRQPIFAGKRKKTERVKGESL